MAEGSAQFVLKDIITQTELDTEEAEKALERMTEKGLIKEIVDVSGKKTYDAT